MNFMVVNTDTRIIDNVVVADKLADVYVTDTQTVHVSVPGAEIGATLDPTFSTVIAPPVIPVVVPPSVTRYQARVALRRAGLRDTVETMVKAAGGDVEDAWNDAAVFERNSNFIVSMGKALGLTDKQIDDLFIMADTIT